MHPGDESGEPVEVRVTDRRRFTDTGDARSPEADGAAPSEPEHMTEPAPERSSVRASEPSGGSQRESRADHGDSADRPGSGRTARGGDGPTAGPDPASGAPPREMVVDLGIEAVFFVFYQSALIALGVPEAGGGQREPDLAEARQAIEFLRVLEAKTAGNLSAEEAETLRQLLDDAQLRYVHVARAMAGGGA